MNKFWNLTMAGIGMLGLAGCGSGPERFDPRDNPARLRAMGALAAADYQEAAAVAINALMGSPVFNRYLQEYQADHGGRKPLMMLSTVRNSTDNEHIDTRFMTERISEDLLNGDKVRLTSAFAGSGQDVDDANIMIRQQDVNEYADKKTTIGRDSLEVPLLGLSGNIITQTDQVGRDRNYSIFFVLTMTDYRTGEVVWKHTQELGRRDTQSWFGF